jgi:hypothetical protein
MEDHRGITCITSAPTESVAFLTRLLMRPMATRMEGGNKTGGGTKRIWRRRAFLLLFANRKKGRKKGKGRALRSSVAVTRQHTWSCVEIVNQPASTQLYSLAENPTQQTAKMRERRYGWADGVFVFANSNSPARTTASFRGVRIGIGSIGTKGGSNHKH